MNEKLFHFDMAESDKCAFCQPEVESIYLFFLNLFIYSFKKSSDFREHVLSWLRDNNIIVVKLKEEDIISDTFDVGDDLLPVNHILIAWEVLYSFTTMSEGYALPSRVHY